MEEIADLIEEIEQMEKNKQKLNMQIQGQV